MLQIMACQSQRVPWLPSLFLRTSGKTEIREKRKKKKRLEKPLCRATTRKKQVVSKACRLTALENFRLR